MNSKAAREIAQLLKQNGFVLIRANGHLVYRNPAGLTHTMPSTPSDHRAMLNNLQQLRQVLAGVPRRPVKQAHMTDAEAKSLFKQRAAA